jgi:hypothetical protein
MTNYRGANQMHRACGLRMLPTFMQMLGHNDIRMTMRYVQVAQQDLQREFYCASDYTTQRHPVPRLPPLTDHPAASPGPRLHSRFDRRRHSSSANFSP